MLNYQKTIAIMTVTGLLLGAAPSASAVAPINSSATTKASDLNGVNTNLIKAAQAKLKEITGKTYTFSKADKWTDGTDTSWILHIKEATYSEVNLWNDEVAYITVNQEWADLKDQYKQQINSALKLTDSALAKLPEKVTLTIGYTDKHVNSGKLELFAVVGNQYVTLLDGEVQRIESSLKLDEVPEATLQAAERVIEGLKDVNNSKLTKASTVLNGKGEKFYELQFVSKDAKQPIFINLKEGTGEITKVEIWGLQDSPDEYTKGYSRLTSYTEAELLKNASAQALQLLDLDLKGYTAAKDKDHPGVVLITKKDSPTVKGTYNTSGQFYTLEVAE